jgi:hypothetical protein
LLFVLAVGSSLLTGHPVHAQPPPDETAPAQPPQEGEANLETVEQEDPPQPLAEEEATLEPSLQEELPDPLEVSLGYPARDRGVAMPANVETDLDQAFPKRDSALPSIPPPRPWFQFKDGLYDRVGLKLAFSYQMIYQGASSSLPAGVGISTGNQTAWAGSVLIEGQWVLYQRDKEYQGSLVTAFDWRHTLQGTAQPAFFAFDVGSLWPTNFYYLSWRPWFPILFYEQAFKRDLFVLRFGNMNTLQFFDFFRFKDPRTSFSGGPFTAPTTTMPFPAPGFGVEFDLRPVKDSEFYISGILSDVNARVEQYSWGEFFKNGAFFYGLELGYFWRRSPGDFDHVHLDLFYAAAPEVSPLAPLAGVGNEPGWGLKAHGSKQLGRFVLFANYTYNTVQGGNFGSTVADHGVTGGLAFLRPFHVRGEWSLGGVWARPINRTLRDQGGLETYWKILFASDIWVTPGLQVYFKPTFDTSKNVLAIGEIRLRLFF